MDSNNPESDEDYERLNETIMRAITSSKEVRALLREYKAKGLVKRTTVLNFLLGLEDLFDSVYPQEPSDPNFKLDRPVREKRGAPEFADPATGKTAKMERPEENMTANEKLFEDYCRKNFDIKRWLKIARIKF